MSTRCQVYVKRDDLYGTLLYHHWDGYPEVTRQDGQRIGMMPLIEEAHRRFVLHTDQNLCPHAGVKAANWIVGVEPDGYEFEGVIRHTELDDHLHGDTQFLYMIKQVKSTWVVSISVRDLRTDVWSLVKHVALTRSWWTNEPKLFGVV